MGCGVSPIPRSLVQPRKAETDGKTGRIEAFGEIEAKGAEEAAYRDAELVMERRMDILASERLLRFGVAGK